MTYARVRQDLIDAGEFPPLQSGSGKELENVSTFFDSNKLYECFQPEVIDHREYNLILVDEDGTIFLSNSIDFDFFNKKGDK